MRNAIIMPIVLVVTLLISLLIGTYISINSVNISQEYYRDLAEVRGYWGAYGAKESNNTNYTYTYNIYKIEISRNGNKYEWNLTNPNSGITNDDLFHRKLEVDINDYNQTISYKK